MKILTCLSCTREHHRFSNLLSRDESMVYSDSEPQAVTHCAYDDCGAVSSTTVAYEIVFSDGR